MKPKPELPAADAIRALADGAGRLAVRVTPNARSASLDILEGKLLVKVAAPPADGKATAAALALIAMALGIAPSRVTLLRGATSREKLVQIGG